MAEHAPVSMVWLFASLGYPAEPTERMRRAASADSPRFDVWAQGTTGTMLVAMRFEEFRGGWGWRPPGMEFFAKIGCVPFIIITGRLQHLDASLRYCVFVGSVVLSGFCGFCCVIRFSSCY